MATRYCVACGEKIGRGRLYVTTADRMIICNRCYGDSGIETFLSGMQLVTDKNFNEIKTIIDRNRKEGIKPPKIPIGTKTVKQVAHDKPDAPIQCPRCGSTQITANKKGFGAGKAAAGVILTGGIGLLAGGIGSKKILITCLKCGYRWKAGKR